MPPNENSSTTGGAGDGDGFDVDSMAVLDLLEENDSSASIQQDGDRRTVPGFSVDLIHTIATNPAAECVQPTTVSSGCTPDDVSRFRVRPL